MATRLKTVEFAMPVLASAVNNTLTSLTQITVYLPETGTKTFRSVVAEVSAMQTATATGNITSRLLQCRLGAAAYTSNTNANLYTGSGEDIFLFHAVDLTSHFTTNWSGTSMTFDAQVTLNGTATSAAWTNICVKLIVTYEYDDTSTTQIKTIRIPLDCPVGALATTKPGAAVATIPQLSTELPEASKVFRNSFITVQGNLGMGSGTTDSTMTLQLDSTAAHTTGTHEGVSTSDYFLRHIWECSSVLNTAASMGFYIFGSVARYSHMQAWLTVTYEFDSTSANDVFVSLLVPSTGGQPGTVTGSSTNFLRNAAEFWVPESGVVSKQIAYYAFWATTGVTAGLNMRVGTGSFVAYTDTAATLCGCAAAMIRNDAAFTVANGKNTLTADVYNTETSVDIMSGFDGFFIVNYTADKPSAGHGAANHSVAWQMTAPYSGANSVMYTPTAMAPAIPESDYFISALGVEFDFYANSTNGGFGPGIDVERLSGEPGGMTYDNVYAVAALSDFESGLYMNFVDATPHFDQFPGDQRSGYLSWRRDPETARRWRFQVTQKIAFWMLANLWITYHAQTWSVSGTITGSAGGTVTLKLCRAATGEVMKTTTRSGNGAYSFTWYNNTESMYVDAYEDGTHLGRSDAGVAA